MNIIKSPNRILTKSGLQTYKAIGLFFKFSNRFFAGNILIRLKYSYKDKDSSNNVLKMGMSHKNLKGYFSKYLEVIFISIPKEK